MKTLLICHEGAGLDQDGLARWLGSFSDFAGMIVLREKSQRMRRRIMREIKRTGVARFFDVLGFRLHYRLFHSTRDESWTSKRLEELRKAYPAARDFQILETHSPNSEEAIEFIKQISPDIMIVRCKTLLKEEVFSIPAKGTYAMHPGICPEYRNAHGCFWALARGDREHVGMTLLRIDKGVDTGPIYGYYSYPFDELNESHVVIQQRVVFDNLPRLEERLKEICAGSAVPLNANGRVSGTWGQPWLSEYLRWKRRARSERVNGAS